MMKEAAREYRRMRWLKENGIRPLSIEGDEDLMRIRQVGYEDYGFSDEEAKKLLAYCHDPRKFGEHELLLKSAISAQKEIANLLYFSITNNCSWERLDNIQYIPISKVDFYAYRRKALALFRNALIECGKWDALTGLQPERIGDK